MGNLQRSPDPLASLGLYLCGGFGGEGNEKGREGERVREWRDRETSLAELERHHVQHGMDRRQCSRVRAS